MTLIGYWPLNEASGSTAYDHSGNENHGTLNGGVTQGATGLLGDKAYSFDGNDDKVQASSLDVADRITASCWVYFNSFAGNDYIINDYSGSGQWFLLSVNDTDGTLQFAVDDSSTKLTVQSNQKLSTGNWNMVTASYSRSSNKMKVYLNGSKVGEESKSLSSIAWSDNVYFAGRGEDNNRQMTGRISEVRIYNRPLTPSEVQYLYSVGKRGLQTTSKKTS